MVSMEQEVRDIGLRALAASAELRTLSRDVKNECLLRMADEMDTRRNFIVLANENDLTEAQANGLAVSLMERLTLDDRRISSLIESLHTIASLNDPVGEVIKDWKADQGVYIQKVRVPIGVIGIIYEARPNVTVDAAALCFKSGNAVILRGGKEARHSNLILTEIMQRSGEKVGLPKDAIQLIRNTDRAVICELVQMEGVIDLVIPRGGEPLIRYVMANAKVPVIKHYKGVCHLYVDESADLAKAEKLVENSKCQRPGVCNALETLLIHRGIAADFLPRMVEVLRARGVEVRGDKDCLAIVPELIEATEDDWFQEYLGLVLAVRIVDTVEDAVKHVNYYGSRHTDGIVAQRPEAIEYFTGAVDSAVVFVNTSTRFNDGGRFGFGAEMGISTDKIHARGPMALEELTTYKYIGVSEGAIVV